ncbi:hypothetical protein B0T25DRAFT_506692 [Lasiosphaeria hispida]|uniref:Uncharacterized protein n=1 Tax=Lasiosphaeria hispida TaxID=260671 RepID=A0AAJ0MAM5_9PEZI|nr:hypothetical protein B0T25DRAFT_506692 [Lasiosphaeria hispida]
MPTKVGSARDALLALGVGIGDVASIFALGRRNGNWWTAVANDKALLTLLNGTESNIVQRRGILELASFNKAWRSSLWLLSNGAPLNIWEPEIRTVLNNPSDLLHELPLFTSIMTCVVAVVDQFTNKDTANSVFYDVLKALFSLGTVGEEMLKAHYTSHVNGWRSTACVRGLSHHAEQSKLMLIQDGTIFSGHMSCTSTHLVQFLVWLLGTNKQTFKTNSMDIAGIATCLRNFGFRIGFREPCEAVCILMVSPEPLPHDEASRLGRDANLLRRSHSVTVSLPVPWETIRGFPVDLGVQNICQGAWRTGQRVAKYVGLGVCRPTAPGNGIHYAFYDQGTNVTRPFPALNFLAERYSLAINQEFLDGLCECHYQIATSSALDLANDDVFKDIRSPEMTDHRVVNGFCVFQAFLMGYYYDIFGRLVDTSTLKLQVVEGAWGFRSDQFHLYMRFVFLWDAWSSPPGNEPGIKIFAKQHVFSVLSLLFLGCLQGAPQLLARGSLLPLDCVGVVSKRGLLTNSLVGKCSSPRDIAGFTLVDADVGGLPRDCLGLMTPGEPKFTHRLGLESPWIPSGMPQGGLKQKGPDEDVTFNIEADWDHNPSSALVSVRYKGRHITAISAGFDDEFFCSNFVPPRARSLAQQDCEIPLRPGLRAHTGFSQPSEPTPQSPGLKLATELDLPTMMENKGILPSPQNQTPVLVQAYNRPHFRYAAAALYNFLGAPVTCRIAADSVRHVNDSATAEGNNIVIIAGTAYDPDDIPITLRSSLAVGPVALDVYLISGPTGY